MTSIPFNTLVIGIAMWTILGVLTAFSIQSSDGLNDIEDVLNSSVQPNKVNIGKIENSGSGILESGEGAAEFASFGVDTVVFIFKAMTLQGPMWDSGWTQPIRAFLWIIGAVFGLYIAYEGTRLLQGFIPFT